MVLLAFLFYFFGVEFIALPLVHSTVWVQAMADLAKIWFPTADISNTMEQCGASTKEQDDFKVGPVGSGFTFQCQEGSVVTLAIKKAPPSGAFTVEILNRALQRLPKMKALLLDRSKLTGHLNSLNFAPGLQRLQMRGCNMEGSLRDLKKYKLTLTALKLSGTNITGSLQELDLSKMKFLDLGHTSVTGNVTNDLPNSLRGLWLQNTRVAGDIMALLKRTTAKRKKQWEINRKGVLSSFIRQLVFRAMSSLLNHQNYIHANCKPVISTCSFKNLTDVEDNCRNTAL